jgi:hypothetical protein
VGLFGEAWKILTVYMGWTYAEWQRSLQPQTEEDSMDELQVRNATAKGVYDVAWLLANKRDLLNSDGSVRLAWSGGGSIGNAIYQNLALYFSEVLIRPLLQAFAALDTVDEVGLANALAPAVAAAVIAGLPEDSYDVTVEELAEAIRSLIVPATPAPEEEPSA